MTSGIPQSDALAEASPDSLSELFSRDPLGLGEADLDRIVATLREQRKRWQAAEQTAAVRAPRASKAPRAVPAVESAEDLGL